MTYLELLQIKDFRGFGSLEIKGLSKINLFVGKNNSGKTSILESLFLLFGMSNPILPGNVNKIRGLGVGTQVGSSKQLKYLFHNLNLNNMPSFYAQFNDMAERWLEMEPKFEQNDFSSDTSSVSTPEINGIGLNFATKRKQSQRKDYKSFLVFEGNDNTIKSTVSRDYIESLFATYIPSGVNDSSATLIRYSDIVKRKGGESILKALQEAFDSNIIALQPLPDGLYFNLKDVEEFLPSNIMGDGVRRFLGIVTAVSEKQNAFVCIDEIENGLHYSAYKWLWKSLLSFSEQNDIQLFITTHNIETLECLKSVLEEEKYKSMQEYAKVFAVSKAVNSEYKAYKYSFEEFKTAIENDIELRK
jgi:AAA15 family ATPase/GTPase